MDGSVSSWHPTPIPHNDTWQQRSHPRHPQLWARPSGLAGPAGCLARLGLWCQLPSLTLLCWCNWSSLALGLSMRHSRVWLLSHGLWCQGCARRVVLTLCLVQSVSYQGLESPHWKLLMLSMAHSGLGKSGPCMSQSQQGKQKKSHCLFLREKI